MGRAALYRSGLALLAFVSALLVAPALARAEATRIELYQLTIQPPGSVLPAHFELDLTYYAPAEHKTSGFKLVGRLPISKLRARSGADGTPLAVKAAAEPGSGETKIDFDLPKPDARGRQRVIVDFDQGLETEHGFFGEIAVVPWAHQFRIPVDRMTLVAEGPHAMSGEGLTCKKGLPRRCARSMGEPFEVTFTTGDASIAWMVVWLATLSVIAVLFVVFFVQRRRQLIELRGVLPPAAPVAYPETAAGYRAPPPLPQPTQAAAVLSEDDTISLWSRALIALAMVGAAQGLLAVCTVGIDLHAALAVTAIIGAIGAIPWGLRGGHGAWLFVALAPLAYALMALSLVFVPILIVGLIVFAIIAAIVKVASLASSGGSGWSTSTSGGVFAASSFSSSSCSSSSSSCSSGSSCGGGGGSSCGGGGGGGGCGG